MAALWQLGAHPFHNPLTPLSLTIDLNASNVPLYLQISTQQLKLLL